MPIMFLFLLLLMAGGNAYVYWRTWQLLPLPTYARLLVVGCMALAFLSQILIFVLRDASLPMGVHALMYKVGNSWMFILLYTVFLFLLLEIARWTHLIPAGALRNNGALSLGIVLFLGVVFGIANYNFHNKQRVAMDIRTSKPLAKPLKIVLLSDIHAGFHIQRDEIAQMVNRINAERPDYVLIGGDLIDIDVRPLLAQGTAEELRRLTAPCYAILGNHEYYAGSPEAQQFFRDANIHVLRDSVVTLPEGMTLIGRDDRTNPRRQPLAALTKNIDPHCFSLLLDHQPYHLEEAERAGIDFQFSGHTHRGQMAPIHWITDALYEKSWGEHQRGNTRYYISSGYGLWGAKFRLGTQSEYLVLTVHN